VERRAFIGALAGGLLAAPLAAEAQQGGKVPRIGVLWVRGPELRDGFLTQGLRDLGYVEDRNILIERRYAEGRAERLPDLAAELVRLKVDVIVAMGTAGTQAARNATKTIPIVGVSMADPVGLGSVASLDRPGGNITGLSFTVGGMETFGKHLQLLKEAVPGVSRVAVLGNPTNPAHGAALQDVKAAAQVLGVKLQPLEARGPSEFDNAFSAMTRERADALLVVADATLLQHRVRLADLATKHRLPTMYGLREHAEAGGLMAFAPTVDVMYRRAATFVDKILKGAKPGDLPVEQPTKYELVINLKTAKALGLTIPPSLLQRADQVIE
jgi:putative ABC transport system substrate-binding protein